MLPFDSKGSQVIIDMPEGTTSRSGPVARTLASTLRENPEVTHYQIYAGTAGPYNFNGLVRHYFLRRGPNVADIQVNLTAKGARSLPSHEIAKSLRERLSGTARELGARIKVAEVPPGPPVLQTLVAEIYGPDYSVRSRSPRCRRKWKTEACGGRRLVRGGRPAQVPAERGSRRPP
jgi:hypothetical protein